ncbi:MAG: hypothetical protein IK102_08450 [Treponema sp.]|nr:hypothetical protein [Treponema sp.]
MTFGFSYIGLIYIFMLIIPNLIWIKHKPADYDKYAAKESKVLLVFERMGEVLVTASALVFADFNLRPWSLWTLWLYASFLLMILYELYWIKYFKSEKTMLSQYACFCGVPVAGATLPVAAFLLLGFYGRNPVMIISVVLLGIGHIGIHLAHAAEAREQAGVNVKEPEPSKLTRFLYILVHLTWGLGQTIIGFFFFLLHIARPHGRYRCALQTSWKDPYAGLSLGLFIFIPRDQGEYQSGARVHEYGHTVQSLILGPFYAIVGIISVGWGSIIFPILKKTRKYKDVPYTKCFIEYWASWLGEKVTGEKAVW